MGKKLLPLLFIFIFIFSTACVTQSGSIIEPRDRTQSLLEALAENPTGKTEEVKADVVLPTPETVRDRQVKAGDSIARPAEAEETAAGEESVSLIENGTGDEGKDAPVIDEAVAEIAPSDTTVIEFDEPVIPFVSSVPEAEAEGMVVPVSGSVENTEPMIYPPYIEAQHMAEPMAPWMGQLMAILVVVIILFTATSAIRSAYKAPLSKVVSISIALLLTALAWVLSYIIAGPSLLYLVYLTLLFTYFMLRSKGRTRDSR